MDATMKISIDEMKKMTEDNGQIHLNVDGILAGSEEEAKLQLAITALVTYVMAMFEVGYGRDTLMTATEVFLPAVIETIEGIEAG